MTSLIVGLDIFFICHKLTFILCGAMTTNEIIGFLYVLIASPWNQYVIIKLFIIFLKDDLKEKPIAIGLFCQISKNSLRNQTFLISATLHVWYDLAPLFIIPNWFKISNSRKYFSFHVIKKSKRLFCIEIQLATMP